MHQKTRSRNGYSLTELLTVVSIIGVVSIVAIPAMLQLLPQYRIRSASSEIASTVRNVRQRAITTRSPWRVSFDPNNERYSVARLSDAPTASVGLDADWIPMDENGRPIPAGVSGWRSLSHIDLRSNTANPLKDVDCPADGVVDIIFRRDGTVAPNAACSGGVALDFTATFLPSIVLAVDTRLVRYNRYYVEFDRAGLVKIRPAKE